MKILNINICSVSRIHAINQIFINLRSQDKHTVLFLNADCIYKAQKDREYCEILNRANIVLPDGIGLKIISMLFGNRIREDCNGTDVCPELIKKAAESEYRIYFLGAKEGVAKKAAENVHKQIPKVHIVGTDSGYFDNDIEVIKKINASNADILFVAMGVPLQEKWISKHRERLNPRLCLGVGALFDYLSGRIPRAPLFMRKMHLEWLWRIFIEPKRMFKRYIIDGARLFWIVLKYKFTSQHSAST